MTDFRTTPSWSTPAPGRRSLLRLVAAAGAAMLAACGGGSSGGAPPRALNLKRDLSKENGASKR
jgi:hypothetical protein